MGREVRREESVSVLLSEVVWVSLSALLSKGVV